MKSDIGAHVRLWKGDPGAVGHWIVTPSTTRPGYYVFSPAKWPNWTAYMQKNAQGWIKGYIGDPGFQGYFKPTCENGQTL